MFPNLIKEMGAHGMTNRSVASAIGMPEATFRHKINVGEFTITEALKISERLFPIYTLSYLFYKTPVEETDTNE